MVIKPINQLPCEALCSNCIPVVNKYKLELYFFQSPRGFHLL